MSVRLLTIKISQWARKNFAVIVKSLFSRRILMPSMAGCPVNFFGSRMQHMIRGWTPTLTSFDLRYLCFSWNLFLWPWIFFKRNLQGEDINPSSKNGANDIPYCVYPQAIAAHEFPLLCCQVRCIKFLFWGSQASRIQSVVWRYERSLENKQNKKQSHKHLFVKCN